MLLERRPDEEIWRLAAGESGEGEKATSYHPAHYEVLTYVYEWPAADSAPQPPGKEQARGQDGVQWLKWLGERGWLDSGAVAAAVARMPRAWAALGSCSSWNS